MSRPYVDSVIVPGNPNPEIVAERADAAYGVFWNQSGRMASDPALGMIVVATGGGEPGNYRSNMVVKELKARGVPKEHIEQEFDSRDTLDNIRNGVPLCQGKRIGFVSNDYHLSRVEYLFSGLQEEGVIEEGLEFFPIPTKTRWRDVFYESLASPVSVLRTRNGFANARLNSGEGVLSYIGGMFYHNGKGGKKRK